jgi:protein tyrosine/serine phosphatase
MEVDVGVWRGSQPKTQEDFDQLKEMGIATLISLQWNKTVEKENEMAKENGIHFMNYPIKANEEIDEATVSKIFRALKNSKKQPIYLHCQFGRDRTGLIFALYRVKVQGWTPKAAYKEWTDMGFDPKFLKHLLAYFVEETGYDPIKKKPALGPGCGRSYGKLSSS